MHARIITKQNVPSLSLFVIIISYYLSFQYIFGVAVYLDREPLSAVHLAHIHLISAEDKREAPLATYDQIVLISPVYFRVFPSVSSSFVIVLMIDVVLPVCHYCVLLCFSAWQPRLRYCWIPVPMCPFFVSTPFECAFGLFLVCSIRLCYCLFISTLYECAFAMLVI